MKVENITIASDEDYEGPIYTGNCPKCGAIVVMDRHGGDEECCGEPLEWDLDKIDKRPFQQQMDDFWAEVDYGY